MIRFAVLILTVFTGFSGLAYEVTWQKYFATLLGTHSEATAAVLGLFLGGLAVGYWVFGAVTQGLVARGRAAGRQPPLLFVYGLIEAGIGAYCLLFPWIFRGVLAVSVKLPVGAGGLSFALDIALAAVLIGPPAVLMGSTIPILTQALARSLADATRFHALVYGFNTAGAFAGALAAGFVLIPWLGLDGVMRAMGVVNLGAGAAFVLLGLLRRDVADLAAEAARPATRVSAIYGGAALLVGFAMMSVQTVLIRIGGLALGSSEFTFSMVVAVFVLCIAIGSLLVSALGRIGRAALPLTLLGLSILLLVQYAQLPHAPYYGHVLRTFFRDHAEAFLPYQLAVFQGLLVAIGPAVILSGAALPLLFHAVRQELGDLGASAGRLYSLNTIGSLLGALLGGYLLLFWLDLYHVQAIAILAVIASVGLVTVRLYPHFRLVALTALPLGTVLLLVWMGPWQSESLSAGFFRTREPAAWSYEGPRHRIPEEQHVFHDDGPASTVVVSNLSRTNRGVTLMVNGKSDGNTVSDRDTMALSGLVPALFAEKSERVFVIGYGTGISVGELAALEEVTTVTVAEISSAVTRAAPFFDHANGLASQNPKVEIVRRDAYRAILENDEHYDVIVSEPSNPWVSGVAMLFSREFLEAARDHLTPGGVYAQWYHLYENDAAGVELVLRTYASVFDDVAVWQTQTSDVLLVGFRDASRALDLERLESRAGREDFRAGFLKLGIEGFSSLLVHEILPLGVVHAANYEGPVHTLYRPRLGYLAGRAFFRGGVASLPFTGYGEPARIGAENSLLRRYLKRFDERVPDGVRKQITSRACGRRLIPCAALLADWARTDAESEAFLSQLDRAAEGRGRDGWTRSLPQFRLLLDDPSVAIPERVSLSEARRADEDFRRAYFHAVPFDSSALVEIWKQCRERSDRGGCTDGLRAARALAAGRHAPAPVVEDAARDPVF